MSERNSRGNCRFSDNKLGMVIDRDYRITAEAVGFTINKKKGDDLSRFPIEKARLRSIWYFMGLLIMCTVGYGWSVETKTVRTSTLRRSPGEIPTLLTQNTEHGRAIGTPIS